MDQVAARFVSPDKSLATIQQEHAPKITELIKLSLFI